MKSISNTDLWNLISSFRIEEKENGDNDGLEDKGRVSVQGVKSLGGHFACLSGGLNFMK
jgi:hypothetical protein